MTVELEFAEAEQQRRRVRKELGRSLRTQVPLEAHAELGPSDRDPIAILEAQAVSRLPGLVPLRYERMSSSSFAFYRGAAAIMAHDLRHVSESGLRTQLCGDAHLSNVGVYASPERALVLDLNDFDETATGSFEWDVKRMAASFEIAARARDFDEGVRTAIVRTVVTGYAAALRDAARAPTLELFTRRLDVTEVLASLADELSTEAASRVARAVAKSQRRDSRQAVARLAEEVDGGLRFRSDPPLLTPLREIAAQHGFDEQAARAWLDPIIATYRESLPPDRRMLLDRFRLVDAAMKVVGVGSVGTRAWIVLLRGNGKDDLLVLQAKEAQRSVLESAQGDSAYPNQGERVVHGQRVMQALSDLMLGWARAAGIDGVERDFYIRQFRDWKGSAEPEAMEPETMRVYAGLCGLVLARAHARGGDAATISGYVGDGKDLAAALVSFSTAYADRTEADHGALLAAIADGRLEASETGAFASASGASATGASATGASA